MRVLVTGCAGFIGSKVSEVLALNGNHVVGVDNLNDASDTRLKEWRLSRLQRTSNFSFHRFDVADREGLGRLFRSQLIEAVVNLAARAGGRQSVTNPWAFYWETDRGPLDPRRMRDVKRDQAAAERLGKYAIVR